MAELNSATNTGSPGSPNYEYFQVVGAADSENEDNTQAPEYAEGAPVPPAPQAMTLELAAPQVTSSPPQLTLEENRASLNLAAKAKMRTKCLTRLLKALFITLILGGIVAYVVMLHRNILKLQAELEKVQDDVADVQSGVREDFNMMNKVSRILFDTFAILLLYSLIPFSVL